MKQPANGAEGGVIDFAGGGEKFSRRHRYNFLQAATNEQSS